VVFWRFHARAGLLILGRKGDPQGSASLRVLLKPVMGKGGRFEPDDHHYDPPGDDGCSR